MKLNVKLIDKIVGLFILIAIIGLVAILVFLGLNQRWFKKNYYFTSKFNSASNLAPGMAITLSGFQIGKVDAIRLEPGNKVVHMDFYIHEEYYSQVVLPNSVIELVSSPIGLGSGLVFHPGKIIKDRHTPLPEGSHIPALNTEEGLQLVTEGKVDRAATDDSIGALIAQVNPILQQIPPVILAAKNLLVDVDESVKGNRDLQLGVLLYEVNNTIRTVEKSLKDVDNILLGRDQGPIGQSLNDVSETLGNVNQISGTLDAIIRREAAKVDALLADVKGITANLEALIADPSGLVVDLIDPSGSIKTFLDDDNKLFNEVEGMLVDVGDIIAELEKFAEFITSTTPQISGILEEGKEALNQGQDVLEGLKNNPLLRGGISKQEEQPSTFNSIRDEEF